MEIKDYPIMLTADHIMEILEVSRPTAYDLMKTEDFPLIKFGRINRVMRDRFFEWLESRASA